MPDVLFPVLVVVAIIGAVFYYRAEQKRKARMRHWAAGHGWSFSDGPRSDWHRQYTGIQVFDKGHSREGKNIIMGRFQGHAVTLCDYRYVTGHGKHRTTHTRGVVILACEFPTIPLHIRREHVFDKVGEFLGADDIDFESVEFSRKFFVKSADRKWAYDVIHTRTMEYLLTAPSFTVEFGYGEIVVYKNGRFDPAGYQEAVKMAATLHDLVPAYVIKEMKGL